MTIFVDFKNGALTHNDIFQHIKNPEHGAQNYFFGAVRKVNLGRNVTGIDYDIFTPLAHNIITEICHEATKINTGKTDIVVIHSFNKLLVGDISIGIAVSTKHRDEAYKACRHIIEEIKKRAPIWKKEFYEDGETKWVQGHALCQHKKN